MFQHTKSSPPAHVASWRPHALALACAAWLPAAIAQAQPVSALNQVTITATLPDRLDAVPGASTVITGRRLDAERPYSVREALQGVPGVHVVGEDAFGLNLNIGVRGLDPRRSARTLLLEDGMPIQLAPYSDPSAHYHTPLERISRIELIKGSGQIVHGPQTVGGVINFVTRATPRQFGGQAELALGTNGFRRAQASLGDGAPWGGWLVEAAHRQGDGTREHHKHRIQDVSLKADLALGPAQGLRLKLGHYREDSSFGEAGLDQARYDADPYQNPFKDDRFHLERTAGQLVHRLDLSANARLSTQVYAQKVFRVSYRQLDAIAEFDGIEDVGGVPTALLEFGTLRSRAPDAGPRNPDCRIGGSSIGYDVPNGFEDRAALCGNQMRPRHYLIWGIEPRLEMSHQALGLRHELVAGLRLHREDIDRRRYNGTTPTAREDSPGTYYRDRNDIDTEALAAYVQNTTYLGNWTITPGLRMERYTQTNTAVLAREDRDVNNGKRVTLKHDKLLPGLGVTWLGLPGTTVFAGVHRGFAPPRPDANLSPTDDDYVPVDPEVSTNMELGLRSSGRGPLQWEATLFSIDFKNQIVPGFAVGLGQTFANAGTSKHRGLELGGRLDFTRPAGGGAPYVSAGWTWLPTARFTGDLLTPEFAPGDEETTTFRNARGKRLPYAPEHTLSVSVGFEHPAGWDMRVGMTHVGQQYSDALNTSAPDPNGSTGEIKAHTTFNAAVNWRVTPKGATVYLAATNLADKQYLASRVNGAVAGARRQVIAGVRLSF
jgi:Fe(3+) dicitrate transport protein